MVAPMGPRLIELEETEDRTVSVWAIPERSDTIK